MRILYLSSCTINPWLLEKYAKALQDAPADIEMVLWCPPTDARTTSFWIRRVPAKFFGSRREFSARSVSGAVRLGSHFSKQAADWLRLRAYVLRTKADVYVAAEPSMLPLACLAARFWGSRYAYVPCEYYPHLSYGSKNLRARYASLERRYIAGASAVVLFGEAAAAEYAGIYSIDGRCQAVCNAWPRNDGHATNDIRTALNLSLDTRLIAYSGIIAAKRGIYNAIAAMQYLPSDISLVMLGWGEDKAVRREADRLELTNRVHVMDPVPPSDLVAWLASADVGIAPILNTCRSYLFCNPSKFFEYIAAGIPLVVSDFPQIGHCVRRNGLGEVFNPADPASIAAAVRRLTDNPKHYEECTDRVGQFHVSEACWEIQAERLRRAILSPARKD